MHPSFAKPEAHCFDIRLMFQAVQNLVVARPVRPSESLLSVKETPRSPLFYRRNRHRHQRRIAADRNDKATQLFTRAPWIAVTEILGQRLNVLNIKLHDRPSFSISPDISE